MPLGKLEASNSSSYLPAGFSSLTSVAISPPNTSNTFSETKLNFGTSNLILRDMHGWCYLQNKANNLYVAVQTI